MTVRAIIKLPDPRLRLVSEPVAVLDRDALELLDDMLETMYDAPGIGLAAIQIGVPKRLVVLDLAKGEEPPAPLFLINPEMIWASSETRTYEEGCLSIPEVYEEVERPESVRVRYLDRGGKVQEIEASGLLATCLQHEIDHTNGVLFIDHISRLKRERVVKKARKAARRGEEGPADRPEP
jgi:peptide deformylase